MLTSALSLNIALLLTAESAFAARFLSARYRADSHRQRPRASKRAAITAATFVTKIAMHLMSNSLFMRPPKSTQLSVFNYANSHFSDTLSLVSN